MSTGGIVELTNMGICGSRKRNMGRETEGGAKSCWQVQTNKDKPLQNVLLFVLLNIKVIIC